MPLGTIHWVPWRSGRGRPLKLTKVRLQIAGFAVSLTISGLIAAAFFLGREVGVRNAAPSSSGAPAVIEAELAQLSTRVDELTQRLVEIADREERIMLAGAGLNMDFTGLMPELPEYGEERDLFRYVDDIDIRLVLAERLARAELSSYDSLAAHFMRVTE